MPAMDHLENQTSQNVSSWENYRNNLPRHLIALARYLQSGLMHNLTELHGHRGLRLHFEPYISLAAGRGVRLSELADKLAISKQAVNQTINQIERAGYLRRIPDPHDGRAKLAVLTNKGEKLLHDGAELLVKVEQEFSQLTSEQELKEFTRLLALLYRGMEYPQPALAQGEAALGWLLPNFSTQVMRELMALTRARGHPGLKMSFGQVLTLMAPTGGRIQEMAAVNEVSKQAISAIASELELLGYLKRTADPEDARQVILMLTLLGARLIEDSILSVAELQTQFEVRVGKQELAAIQHTAERLYNALGLDRELAGHHISQTTDLETMALQLSEQLGAKNTQTLANLLLNTLSKTTDTSKQRKRKS